MLADLKMLSHAVVILVVCSPACLAETANPAPASQPAKVDCADFKHNPDGSWSTLHRVTVGTVTLGTDISLKEGLSLSGTDIAAVLNKQCVPR